MINFKFEKHEELESIIIGRMCCIMRLFFTDIHCADKRQRNSVAVGEWNDCR